MTKREINRRKKRKLIAKIKQHFKEIYHTSKSPTAEYVKILMTRGITTKL